MKSITGVPSTVEYDLVEWRDFAQRYVIIGVPGPQNIAVLINFYNLVNEIRVVSKLLDILLQSEESIVDWVILNIVFANDIWEVLGRARGQVPEMRSECWGSRGIRLLEVRLRTSACQVQCCRRRRRS